MNNLVEYINEYEEWVDKDIPVNETWVEEINMLSFLRDELQEAMERYAVSAEAKKRVEDIDARWIAIIKKRLDPSFKYNNKPDNRLDSKKWWWNVDNLETYL